MNLYHLKFSDFGKSFYKHDKYDEDAVFEMIISAPNDMMAREIAKIREDPGRNSSSWAMWTQMDKQMHMIDCIMIGLSFMPQGVIMFQEVHSSG